MLSRSCGLAIMKAPLVMLNLPPILSNQPVNWNTVHSGAIYRRMHFSIVVEMMILERHVNLWRVP
jgi:hypothetical protein